LQGSKSLESQLFYQISLEQLVPPDHLVRYLAEVLDISWIRKATVAAYSHTGRTSIDPVVISKMMLLGFLYNISSERQLVRDIQVHLAYRWYPGYDLNEAVPNHSVLSKARRRLGVEFFERLFEYVLRRCSEEGLISGENLLIDSTIVQADASLDSISSLRYRPAEYFEQLEQTAEPDINKDNKPGHRRSRKNRSCDHRRSLTDPDATLFRRNGQSTKLAYKAHIAADSHKGVITSVAVSSSSEDDTSEDVYVCPAGRQLRRTRTRKTNCKAYYSGNKETCQNCSLGNQCIGSTSPDAVRQVTRYDSPYSDRAKALCNSSLGSRLFRLGQTCIEGLFGQAKSLHGLTRARWRRLFNMHIQTLLTATVLNLKKLVSSTGKKASVSVVADGFCNNFRLCLYFLLYNALKWCKGEPTERYSIKIGTKLL